ncbi:dienelactone hydrolase family protein [Yunchengibacter salinarum]|uniref:dienelactone hydrolase family protein n=1 Tax=Yunchengibacter salinarum TaxID=3133399 RepID=UPI0035B5CF28
MGETVRIQAKDGSGSFDAYIARPETGNGPGIVAIQEIFGVNDGMKEICDDLAAQGYIAISPDLFWRLEPNISLTDKTQAEWDKAFDLMNRFDIDKGIEDIDATIEHLRDTEPCFGKVGAVGYCLGGLLAYLTACRTKVDATVGFYGVNIPKFADEAQTIQRPLMLHIAEEDEFVDKESQKAMHDLLDDHPLVTLHDYAGVSHAFARPNGVHHDADAAARANDRTREFFQHHLKDKA